MTIQDAINTIDTAIWEESELNNNKDPYYLEELNKAKAKLKVQKRLFGGNGYINSYLF